MPQRHNATTSRLAIQSALTALIVVSGVWFLINFGVFFLPTMWILYLNGISSPGQLLWLAVGVFTFSFCVSVYRRDVPLTGRLKVFEWVATTSNRNKVLLSLAVLAAVHLWIYWDMYFGAAGFGYDFTRTYYAVPYYWIASIRSGHGIPFWIPNQAMGYPLLLNVQSGVFYPPFYFFVLTGIPYTYHAAVVFQCLHILVGAFGAFFFFRRWQFGYGLCVLGALAFEFFGGFFSNGQHADIVRGYALIPWFLFALTANKVPRRNAIVKAVVLPLCTYLLFTGAYPGLALATVFLGFVYLGFESTRNGIKAQSRSAGLIVLGLLLASIQLLPSFMMRGEIQRQQTFQSVDRTFLTVHHLFTGFMPYYSNRLSGDLSMRSLFIGLPLCLLLLFVGRRDLKQHLAFMGTLAVAALMILGSPLYTLIAKAFSPLGLSRFPAADYRGVLALLLIGFGLAGLRHLFHGVPRWTSLRLLIFVAVVAGAVVDLHYGQKVGLLGPLFLSLIACLGLPLAAGRFNTPSWRLGLIGAVSLFLILDATRILEFTVPWELVRAEADYQAAYGTPSPSAPPASLLDTLKGLPHGRPARDYVQDINKYTWRGYLDGSYQLGDYAAGIQFRRQIQVLNDPEFRAFMQLPSAVALIPEGKEHDEIAVRTAIATPSTKARIPVNGVSSATSFYGGQTILRDITLTRSGVVVENELFYPGWTAYTPGGKVAIVDVLGLFRGLVLPARENTVVEEYSTPFFRPAEAVSALALLLWLATIASALRRAVSVRPS